MLIDDLRLVVVNGSPHSNWVFVEVSTTAGTSGWGEATLDGATRYVRAAFENYRQALIGRPVGELRKTALTPPAYPAPLPMTAVASALDQAFWDLQGKALGASVWRLLGGDGRPLPYYANINRGLGGRRGPGDFAACAAAAARDGATAIKCAPFDGVSRTDWEDRQTRSLIQQGIDRIAAVRDALPDGVSLLVDCHWRFSARTAVRVLRLIEQFDPYWVEAPVSELDLDSWRHVRGRTELRLAGGEMLGSLEEFRRFLASGVDVVMPDVKYCGGISGVLRVGAIANSFSTYVSPHNPSGPVASLASAHAASALGDFLILEWPWGESAIRADLVGGAEVVHDGHLVLPAGPGLGLSIDEELVRRLPESSTVGTVDSFLFGPGRPVR